MLEVIDLANDQTITATDPIIAGADEFTLVLPVRSKNESRTAPARMLVSLGDGSSLYFPPYYENFDFDISGQRFGFSGVDLLYGDNNLDETNYLAAVLRYRKSDGATSVAWYFYNRNTNAVLSYKHDEPVSVSGKTFELATIGSSRGGHYMMAPRVYDKYLSDAELDTEIPPIIKHLSVTNDKYQTADWDSLTHLKFGAPGSITEEWNEIVTKPVELAGAVAVPVVAISVTSNVTLNSSTGETIVYALFNPTWVGTNPIISTLSGWTKEESFVLDLAGYDSDVYSKVFANGTHTIDHYFAAYAFLPK